MGTAKQTLISILVMALLCTALGKSMENLGNSHEDTLLSYQDETVQPPTLVNLLTTHENISEKDKQLIEKAFKMEGVKRVVKIEEKAKWFGGKGAVFKQHAIKHKLGESDHELYHKLFSTDASKYHMGENGLPEEVKLN